VFQEGGGGEKGGKLHGVHVQVPEGIVVRGRMRQQMCKLELCVSQRNVCPRRAGVVALGIASCLQGGCGRHEGLVIT